LIREMAARDVDETAGGNKEKAMDVGGGSTRAQKPPPPHLGGVRKSESKKNFPQKKKDRVLNGRAPPSGASRLGTPEGTDDRWGRTKGFQELIFF